MNPPVQELVLSVKDWGKCPRNWRPITIDDPASDPAALNRFGDAELLRRMQADDLDAFEAFFYRHQAIA
jgi:hypothetical protein